MNNIIMVKDAIDFECNNIEEVVKFIFGKNYYDLNEEEKLKLREFMAYKECLGKNIEIILKRENINKENINTCFIALDEISYIISLLKYGNLVILEEKNSNIFSKYINKSSFEKLSKNYIMLNKFANEMIDNYIF